MAAPALPASSTILLRDAEAGPEVYLLRRHGGVEFMAEVYVFPGGRVDDSDSHPAWDGCLWNLSESQACERLGDIVDGAEARAFWVAALRETLEEAGILFLDASGHPQPGEELLPAVSARLACAEQGSGLRTWLTSRGLRLNAGELTYWDRWITPRSQPKRYDARFFVARMPCGQNASPDGRETTHGIWVRPSDALAAHARGEVALGPPQIRILHDLSEFPSTAAVLEAAKAKCPPLPPNLPEPHVEDGQLYLLLPGDKAYSDPNWRGAGLHRAKRVGQGWTLIRT